MGKSPKSKAWLNLTVGLLWLFIAARDTWMPGFMSISGKHHADQTWLSLVVGMLFLFAGCTGLMRMRASSAR